MGTTHPMSPLLAMYFKELIEQACQNICTKTPQYCLNVEKNYSL